MLVEQQAADGRSVTDLRKRIQILVSAADFLYPVDPDKAKLYFIDAFSSAQRLFADKGFENTLIGKSKNTSYAHDDMRTVVIRAVAKHDHALAKKFADQLLADYEKQAKDRTGDRDREPQDLLLIARSIAKSDPVMARYLIERVMKYPLEEYWFFVLPGIAEADQTLGDTLYAEALRNYSNETPSRLRYLSAYPFGRLRAFGGRSTLNPLPAFVPNVPLQRAFLQTFFDRVAKFAASSDDIARTPEQYEMSEPEAMSFALADMEPVIVESFPELLQRFSEARSQANSLVTADMRKDMEATAVLDKTRDVTFGERLQRLEDADEKGLLTDEMIVQAYISLFSVRADDDFKKFEPWVAKIKDDTGRKEATSYFWYLRSELAIKDGRYDEADKMAAKVPELDHRSILLLKIAQKQLANPNEAPQAFDMLNNVSKAAHSAPDSVAKAQVLLGLATFYENVNHSIALDELGEAVKVLNRLEDPDVSQSWIYRQILVKDYSFTASISLPGVNFESTLNNMGKRDFEMTLANAKTLDDKYLRTTAVIAIAKNCVQPAPVPRKKN
jgi:hypothetical protein